MINFKNIFKQGFIKSVRKNNKIHPDPEFFAKLRGMG